MRASVGTLVDRLYARYRVEGADVLRGSSIVRTVQKPADLLGARALFLVTPGRSGTQSLVDYCKRHTSMYSLHSPSPWLASQGYAYHRGEMSADAARASFFAARESHLSAAFERDLVLFDGDCKSLPLAPVIAAALPAARFLHVVRNPRAFILSGLKRGYFDRLPPAMWGHLEPRSERIEDPVERVAWFWNEANLVAERMKEDLPPTKITTLVADEMFVEQKFIDEALRRVGLADQISTSGAGPMAVHNRESRRIEVNNHLLRRVDDAISKRCTTASHYFSDGR